METPAKQHIFTISELNRAARYLLEDRFPVIWVEGEISNLIQHTSGHWYFTLKDNNAQIRCAMFRNSNQYVNFSPDDGVKVLTKGKISLYENRGDYQLIVNHMEELGAGALQREFEKLKNKLEKQGLFDSAHKKSLPEFPNTIGVITSPTGAAVRDILNVLARRYPFANVIIYPTLVQGDEAHTQIVNAITIANNRNEADVLLVTRGGGSLEDLWPFNEEDVANAIFNSVIPIVSGIGHEIDFTIADFVADFRAPTPSAAAETVSPNQSDLLNYFQQLEKRITKQMLQIFRNFSEKILWLKHRLKLTHPEQQLIQNQQKLDQLEKALITTQKRIIENSKNRLAKLAGLLNSLSPLNIISRGYSILTDNNNHTISSTKQVKPGDKITAKVTDGEFTAIVDT